VLFNGRLWTGPPCATALASSTALALEGDRILATGRDAEMLELAGPETRRIDAGSGLIVPGLQDSHVHFRSGARNLANLELSAETTVEGILSRIKEFARAHREREWLTGRGWFYAVFPGGMPHRDLLDSTVPERPVALEAYDSHSTWVNSVALSRLGITRDTPDPPRGEIVRDPEGRPSGVLKEAAMELVDRRLPQPTRQQDLESLSRAMAIALRHGITGVQEAGAGIEEFELYDALAETGRARLRVRLGQQMQPGLSMTDWEKRLTEWEPIAFARRQHPWVAAGIVKGFADGVVESETAMMLAPYQGKAAGSPGALGRPHWEAGELAEAVRVADARGWQIQVHAIGDGAVRLALDAYESAMAINGPRERRHRIEHIETVDPLDIPTFARLGIIASMQPYHADPEPAQLDLFISKIGERASRGWAWGSIARAGGRLAFGSDWPVVDFDPRLGLNSAVHRTTVDGRPSGGWLPDQKLSVGQALTAYTAGAAYAGWQDDRMGKLEPGMLADVVVLDQDILRHPDRIMEMRALLTIVGGRVAYERNSETND
jgi:predicted amidohydrolase YtcJ